MNDQEDFNPHAHRQRKKNRVSRGAPERPRRYYAKPILWFLCAVFAIQSGLASAIVTGLTRAAIEGVERADRALSPDPKECELQLQRARIIVSQADALIKALADELNKEKAERLKREYEELERQQKIIVNSHLEWGASGTADATSPNSAATAPAIRTYPGETTIVPGTTDLTTEWTVHPPEGKPTPQPKKGKQP